MRPAYIAGVVIIAGILILSVLPRPAVQSQGNELKKFSSYDELQQFVKNNIQESSVYETLGAPVAMRETMQPESAQALSTGSAEKSADYSGTNVQVAGVDEPDYVKTDGRYIYTISGNSVIIADAYPAETAGIVAQINFTNSSVREIFINRDRLVVFGVEYNYQSYPPSIGLSTPSAKGSPMLIYSTQTSFIKIYDVSDRTNPVPARSISADGYYFNSRMIGDYVYAIVNQPVYYYDVVPLPRILPAQSEFPDIYYFDILDRSYNYINIIAVNTQNDEDYTSKTFMLPSSENIFVSENNIYLTYVKWFDYRYFYDRLVDEVIIPSIPQMQDRITNVRSLPISNASKYVEIQAIVEEYISRLNPEEQAALGRAIQERMEKFQSDIAKEQQKTIINRISISGSEINYAAQGAVPGYVLNQFSMDEYNSHFRITTTVNSFGGFMQPFGGFMQPLGTVMQSGAIEAGQGSTGVSGLEPEMLPKDTIVAPERIQPRQPESLNNLYVLDSGMNIVGKVEDLAPGERIYATRFAGNRAYVVTFRQVDPLFVIDLSDPANPKVLGSLKITGVSNYLQPVDDNHIIGIGKDATDEGMLKGLKISLFDVSDVSDPVEISKILIGDRGSDSQALYDHKAVLFNAQKKLLVIPVMLAEIDPSKYGQPIPSWAYGEPKWQGAYVFSIEDGLKIRGRIGHASAETNGFETFYGQYAVSRSLYIGNVLYTISGRLIRMDALDTLEEINKLELPGHEQPVMIYS